MPVGSMTAPSVSLRMRLSLPAWIGRTSSPGRRLRAGDGWRAASRPGRRIVAAGSLGALEDVDVPQVALEARPVRVPDRRPPVEVGRRRSGGGGAARGLAVDVEGRPARRTVEVQLDRVPGRVGDSGAGDHLVGLAVAVGQPEGRPAALVERDLPGVVDPDDPAGGVRTGRAALEVEAEQELVQSVQVVGIVAVDGEIILVRQGEDPPGLADPGAVLRHPRVEGGHVVGIAVVEPQR